MSAKVSASYPDASYTHVHCDHLQVCEAALCIDLSCTTQNKQSSDSLLLSGKHVWLYVSGKHSKQSSLVTTQAECLDIFG